MLLIPTGLFIGYYLIFYLFQNLGPFLAPIIAGILSALLPFFTDYLFTGHFELTDTKSALTATIAGLGTLIVASMASIVRERLEEKK
jgi:hypothetical protein